MTELKWIGAALISLSSAYAGMRAAWTVKQMSAQLKQLLLALELAQCEIHYAKTPLVKLCDVISRGTSGEVSRMVSAFGAMAGREDFNPGQAAQMVVTGERLTLPAPVLETVRDFLSGFGRYDAQGELAMIQLTRARLEEEQRRLEMDKRNRCRLYETLGICTGLALMILVV